MSDRVHLELSPDQARAVVAALDLANRISLGQIGEIATLLTTDAVRMRDDHASEGWSTPSRDVVERVEDLTRDIAVALGHRGSHFGIGARGVPLQAKRQYEVQKALSKALADRYDPGGITVHHDGLRVRYTGDDAPTARMTTAPMEDGRGARA